MKTNNITPKNAKFTKIVHVDQFLSTSKVHSPTHLTRLWFFGGPTDSFTNLLIRLRVRRRPVNNVFEIRIPRLYMSHTAHGFTSKIYILRGVSSHEKRVFWSYMYIVALWQMKDQIRKQNLWKKMKPIKVQSRALTCIWSKERPHLCCFSDPQPFCLWFFWDRACIYKWNELSRNFFLVLFAVYDMP